MSEALDRRSVVLALGLVDERGVVGSALPSVEWSAIGPRPLAQPGEFTKLFGRSDETYRRIDRMSRALVIAVEASGVRDLLTPEQCAETALVLETVRGCLESDVRFAEGLRDGVVRGPLFPYTLPSTCLGEVALRHGLRGPTVCLSTLEDGAGAALWEAEALVGTGEALWALACSVEVLEFDRPPLAAALRATAVLIGSVERGRAAAVPWPARAGQPFADLARHLPRVSR